MNRFKRIKPTLCKCRCGNNVKWNKWNREWNQFILGHNMRFEVKGPPPLCKCGCNKPTKLSTRRKNWNTFIRGHNNRGKELSEDHKRKLSIALKGREPIRGMLGKKHSEETRRKMSAATKGKNNPMYGKIFSKEYKQKLSISRKNVPLGDKQPNWQGGISCKPYNIVWIDKNYKNSIRKRDNYKCQNPNCDKKYNQNIALSIHHINYNKKNCHDRNLISLCRSCNSKANKNRQLWRTFYQEIMSTIHPQNKRSRHVQ